MNMQDALQQELTPADLLAINHKATVKTLTSRAPELVEQLQTTPDELITLAKQIEALEPLPLVPELPAETPYPTEALLGMDEAVFEISNKMKFSPALVGQSALGLANGIIQALCDVVKPASTTPTPCSLFLLSGADSGGGKTKTDSILTTELTEKSTESDLSYQAKREDYSLCIRAYNAEVKKIENDKGISQGEREQAFRELTKPQPPMNPRFKVDDGTIEGIGRQFREGCTRLSIMTDEGALLFGNHTLQNERRSAVMGRLCKMWDGSAWHIDRGAQENNYSLIGRRLAMSISTQPDVLRGVMSDSLAVNQGFIPRFLVAMPQERTHERKIVFPEWKNITAIREYWKKLSELYDITPPTRTDQPLILTPRKLSLTAEAARLYEAFGNQCFRDACGRLAPVKAMTLKGEDNLLRIAATLSLWNNHSAGTIDSESVEAAAHLMDYYLNEGLRIADFSSELSDDSDLSMAAELLNWAKASGAYLVHSRMLTQHAPKRAMRKARTIERLMNILVEHGHAIRLEGSPVLDGKPRQKAWLITS